MVYLEKNKVALSNLVSFTGLLLTKSNLRSKMLDFASWRTQTLQGLEAYLPEGYSYNGEASHKKKNAVLFNLIATAAHIKNAWKETGGHLSLPKQKLFYVRIPKSASTSLGTEILCQRFSGLNPDQLNTTQFNFLIDAWLEKSLNVPEHQTGFTIVRHPFTRLASVYHDIIQNKDDRPFIYQNYLCGVLEKGLSFEEFVSRISKIPDRLKDQHFKPQHLFIKPYNNHGYDVKILKLEEPELLDVFAREHGLRVHHLNTSNESHSHNEFYSKRALEIANKMYAHDFKLFNYEQKIGI